MSAARQLDNVANALKALQPDDLRALGLPTVNYHDLLDAASRLSTARNSLVDIQEIAEKHGAIR